jgi:RNA polymerase sigma-70 factor (ECF subfamily)
MKDKLFRFAFRLLQNAQEAEDVVQDVMVRLWVKRDEWGQWQSLEGYCMIAARNACLDRKRRPRPVSVREESAAHLQSNDKDPYEKIMNKEAGIRIRQCMEALPENQRLVIQLREIEGFSYAEISEVLDMSMEQVKVNLFRARNAMKNSIIKGEAIWNSKK